ncbi:MAG: hypothetical protein HZA61_00870 [Candidatus Eisenbacteria bacterium]|uniref:Uncharacterized protein n=1 Tax=Eiseniibacteriota bacterium TaxID=2212470 RepID=A0A933S8T1_UNCEI|nr:hypothetical protein [Candidatus Eisenbacteria bacterium]
MVVLEWFWVRVAAVVAAVYVGLAVVQMLFRDQETKRFRARAARYKSAGLSTDDALAAAWLQVDALLLEHRLWKVSDVRSEDADLGPLAVGAASLDLERLLRRFHGPTPIGILLFAAAGLESVVVGWLRVMSGPDGRPIQRRVFNRFMTTYCEHRSRNRVDAMAAAIVTLDMLGDEVRETCLVRCLRREWEDVEVTDVVNCLGIVYDAAFHYDIDTTRIGSLADGGSASQMKYREWLTRGFHGFLAGARAAGALR